MRGGRCALLWRERSDDTVCDISAEVRYKKLFTHRSVSTFDPSPFQLTDELFLYGMALSGPRTGTPSLKSRRARRRRRVLAGTRSRLRRTMDVIPACSLSPIRRGSRCVIPPTARRRPPRSVRLRADVVDRSIFEPSSEGARSPIARSRPPRPLPFLTSPSSSPPSSTPSPDPPSLRRTPRTPPRSARRRRGASSSSSGTCAASRGSAEASPSSARARSRPRPSSAASRRTSAGSSSNGRRGRSSTRS